MRGLLLISLLIFAGTGLAETRALDLKAVDASLANVAIHARNYPPRFANEDQRKKTEAILRETMTELDAALRDRPDDRNLLFRAGVANSLGHNLDFPEAAKRCAEVFEHLLKLHPEDGRAQWHYGIFLAGSGRQEQGLAHLKKALELGVPEANFSLAITYLSMEDKDHALRHLQQYAVDFPRDMNAQRLLEAMTKDDFKITKKVLPPGEKPPSSNPISGVAQP